MCMSLVNAPNMETEPTPNPDLLLGRTIENLLLDLPIDEALALRLGGVSHRLTVSLLQQLMSAAGIDSEKFSNLSLKEIWDQAILFRFAELDEEEALIYRPRVRAYLQRWWRSTHPEQFIAVNQAALGYFRSAAARSELPFDSLLSPDIVYHWLIVDETAALLYLAEQFEDACDRHQLSLAEHLSNYASERFEAVTPQGQQWLRYYQARIALLHNQLPQANLILNTLLQNKSTPEVSAVAQWNLGQQFIQQQRWAEAIQSYRTALSMLSSSQTGGYRVRILMSIGDAYSDLALATGGLDLIHEPPQLPLRHLRTILQFLPFLIYKWLVHSVDLLPNWYFGGNYQNWLAADLLLQAATWYRKAVAEANKMNSPFGLVEAQITLAGIEHQLGRWTRAHRYFSQLLKNEVIQQGRFRWARLQLNVGLAWLSEHRYGKAENALVDASDAFESFSEQRLTGFTHRLLGRLYASTRNWQQSLDEFVQSIHHYHKIVDSRNTTQSLDDAKRWLAGGLKVFESGARLTSIRSELKELLYICRFPDRSLKSFRRLALYIAIPLTYLFAFPFILLTFATSGLIVEGLARLFVIPGALSALIAHNLLLLVILLLTPLLLLWVHHFIYSFAGFIWVRLWGRNLTAIENEQPSQILVTDDHLIYRDHNHPRQSQSQDVVMQWSTITQLIDVEYHWRTQVIALISRIALVDTSGQAIVINAVTTDYEFLRTEISSHLATKVLNPLQEKKIGLTILKPIWVALAGGFATIIVIWHSMLKGIEPGVITLYAVEGREVRVQTWLTNITWQFLWVWILLFVNLTLWRLLYYRIKRRTDISLPPLISTWLLCSITLLHLLFSVILAMGALS